MTKVQLILTYGIDKAKDIASRKLNSTTVEFLQKENNRPRLDSDSYKNISVKLDLLLNSEKSELAFATQSDQDALLAFASKCNEMQKSFAAFVESTDPNWIVTENNEADKEDFLNGLTDGKTLNQILKIFADIKTAEAPKTPPILPMHIATEKSSPSTEKHPREESQSPRSKPKRLSL